MNVLRRVLVGDDGINVSFLKMGRASRAIVSHDQVVSPEYPVPIKSNGDEASTIVGLRGRSNQHELTELKANFGPPPPITTKPHFLFSCAAETGLTCGNI
ncbi:hypothetical protein HID58_003197 [Brassica napus]|uniref:Uncharacterized protein n=1 Tax=Brassica napus TaxID=3708 RepID=A0ABQ8EPJ9_BRANA|nr:hypothetical protein HID58_003197 [Brassica napus]